jgi:hypothetical protein
MKKTVSLVIVIVFLTIQMNAFVTLNDVHCLFNEGSEKIQIEENMIDGAAHFLLSKSYADLLLYEYEKSAKQEFNFSMSLEYLEKAIQEVNFSKMKYAAALDIGRKIGYAENKIDWFKTFNYDDFIRDNKLNKEISEVVKSYLVRYDVIGIYQQNIDYINQILYTLNLIKYDLKAKRRPDVMIYWSLLQQYSETVLFGNYSTVMGGTILGQCDDGP